MAQDFVQDLGAGVTVVRSRDKVKSDGPHVFTDVAKQTRTYTFPTGKVTIEGVVSINVSKSGTHRINTENGKKHLVPAGWIHIEFDAPHWSF